MPTLILVRHGRSTANASGILAGHLPDVALDDEGRRQAESVGRRLRAAQWVDVVTSPVQRCVETAAAITAQRSGAEAVAEAVVEAGLQECDYGTWQGRSLKELVTEPLWREIQQSPSTVVFPAGESMSGMQERAVEAVGRHDARVLQAWGDDAVWVAVSHGDIIKSVLADALGLHLDRFQRLHVDPGSVSVIRYAQDATTVLATNSHEGDLGWLAAGSVPRGGVPGGGSGPAGRGSGA